MFRGSLRARLILAYAGLIVLGFGLLALIAGRQISDAAIVDFERGLDTQALLIANGLAGPVSGIAEGQSREAELSQLLITYSQQTGARVIVVNPQGHAWADSSGVLPTEPQSAYPEVAAALSGRVMRDVRDDGSGTQTYYVAAPIRADEGLVGVVRLAAPAETANRLVTQRWLSLGAGVGLLALLGLVASIALAASLARPLEHLRQSAMKLAGGDLSQRVTERGPDEIRQLGSTFNYLAAQVQAMLDEQRAFASNASHELRAPLTAIRLRSEALRAGQLDPQTARQYIAEIDDEAIRMGTLIEDLILLSRLDAGRVKLSDEWVEPARFARGLLREMEPIAEAHGVALTLDAPDQIDSVQAGLNHLRVAFRNLLDNAIKYTPPGGSVVWQLRAEGGSLVSRITDTGIGISADDLPHLFKRFFRADRAHSRSTPGVGLGLALARSVARFYGGEIAISSAGAGQGATALVRWPLKQKE